MADIVTLGPVAIRLLRKRYCRERINLIRDIRRIEKILDGHCIDQICIKNKRLFVSVYRRLTAYLEKEENKRIVLYLPFELIPSISWFNTGSNRNLNIAVEAFCKIYIKRWSELLNDLDPRANYVDGDIQDRVQGRTSSVVKAAHLIPFLLKKGMISDNELEMLVENPSNEYFLGQSLLDATSTLPLFMKEPGDSISKFNNYGSLIDLEANITLEFEILKKNLHISGTDTSHKDWKIENLKINLIRKFASSVAFHNSGDNILRILRRMKNNGGHFWLVFAVYLEAFRISVLDCVNEDVSPNLKKSILEILHVWHANPPTFVKKIVERMALHFQSHGLIDKKDVDFHKQITPASPNNFLNPLENLSKSDKQRIRKIVKIITHNKEILKIILPVVVVYGSKIKGYASFDSDIDLAVFIRPGVDFSNRSNDIKKEIDDFFGEKLLKFWLGENNNKYFIENQDGDDRKNGSDGCVGVLFDSIWVGDRDVISKLNQEIFRVHFSANAALRQVWLRELERDSILYRLLHSGYDYHYPESKNKYRLSILSTIDGRSSYYDSGYRWLATQLYIAKVYIPHAVNEFCK